MITEHEEMDYADRLAANNKIEAERLGRLIQKLEERIEELERINREQAFSRGDYEGT